MSMEDFDVKTRFNWICFNNAIDYCIICWDYKLSHIAEKNTKFNKMSKWSIALLALAIYEGTVDE